MPATADGRAACRHYLARRGGADASMWTVGAVLLRADRLRTFAEYGEGNDIAIERVDVVARGSRVRGRMTHEGDAPADTLAVTLQLARHGTLLDWQLRVEGDAHEEHATLAYCDAGRAM